MKTTTVAHHSIGQTEQQQVLRQVLQLHARRWRPPAGTYTSRDTEATLIRGLLHLQLHLLLVLLLLR